MAPAPVTTQKAQPVRGGGRPRRGGSLGSGQARRYAFPAKTEAAASDSMITVGDTIVVDFVYRSCVVTIWGYKTRVDLLPLSMVDFDMLLGMDWLSPWHTILNCHAQTVILAMSGVLGLERRGFLNYVPSRVISHLKAQRMVEKGCLAYLAFVRDVSADTTSIESAPVVRDFSDVFSTDLSGMPPDRDNDFGIDLVPGTQSIYISTYRMAPIALKELKQEL
ncbi:uncharacterized protein [Nicotiana tomentosiformis]|uniref:uncharacterized protein n=1 Tax=Nicotiana tomentosiformis TaxID=4098 RepID=UPI00388C6E1C